MYSIRINAADRKSHEVFPCASYNVRLDGRHHIITYAVGDAVKVRELQSGEAAFIMNEQAYTVEVLREK